MSRCENNPEHTGYCESCATCHDCLAEHQERMEVKLANLKEQLQVAINERNEAWFRNEELSEK